MTTTIQQNSTMHLEQRNFQRITNIKPGSELFCDAGLLWVTQTGDYTDYILRPGDAMTVSKRGKVLVEAMREADYHLA